MLRFAQHDTLELREANDLRVLLLQPVQFVEREIVAKNQHLVGPFDVNLPERSTRVERVLLAYGIAPNVSGGLVEQESAQQAGRVTMLAVLERTTHVAGRDGRADVDGPRDRLALLERIIHLAAGLRQRHERLAQDHALERLVDPAQFRVERRELASKLGRAVVAPRLRQ